MTDAGVTAACFAGERPTRCMPTRDAPSRGAHAGSRLLPRGQSRLTPLHHATPLAGSPSADIVVLGDAAGAVHFLDFGEELQGAPA
jgi:hypothetical protein